jgi:hypothetical protein
MLLEFLAQLFAFGGDVRELLSAAKACWMAPAFCIRSAYSMKFCLASAMKPFAAYSLASFKYVVGRPGALRNTLLHIAMALLWNPSSAYRSTARS